MQPPSCSRVGFRSAASRVIRVPRGFTLPELLVVLLLLSLVLGAGAPAARRQVDRSAVVGAREGLVGLLARARSEALAHGGARVLLTREPPAGEVWVRDRPVARLELDREWGVSLELSGERKTAELRFDALGVGRVASQTLRIRRGDAEATLVISSYGRATRR